MTTTLGTRITASPTFPGNVIQASTVNQRAFSLPEFTAPSNGYITHLGGYLRKTTGTNVGVYLAVYAVDADGTPAQQLGRTARFIVNSAGADFQIPIAWSAVSLSGAQTSIRVLAGQRFAIAVKGDTGPLEVAAIPGTSMQWRKNNVTTGPPTDPFAPVATAVDVNPALYAQFEPNRDPTVTLTSPANAAALGTAVPTFTGTFTDLDSAAPLGDTMSAYALEVTDQATGSLVWGGAGAVFAASAAEKAAGTFSRVYAGATLTSASGPYEWRARVFDASGASSAWSAPRTFTINATGQVDTSDATTPAAKVETASSLIDWGGRWFHPTGLAANAAQVRVLIGETVLRTGTLVTLSPTVASSALPGTSFTVQDTAAGIGALAPGTYSYQIQARATDSQFSPWSTPKPFVVNAPPTVPSNLQPPNGSITTSRPLAEWNVTDPDVDDIFGVDDDSEILLTRPNGTTITITTTNYDAATQKGFYQFSSSDVLDAVRGRYTWKVRGRDTSAGTLGEGPWSLTQAFDFLAGPVVTVNAPAANAVVTTSVPTITWTVTGATQARFQVRAYRVDQAAAFIASPIISGVATSYQIPTGWLQNGGVYDIDVQAWDAGNNRGVSLRRQFSVSYASPATLTNLQASPFANRHDPIIGGQLEPSSVLVSWDPSALPPNEFAGYLVRRRLVSQAIEEALAIPVITAIGQAQWIDHLAPPNTQLIYTVSQLRRVSAVEILESAAAEITMSLVRSVPILCSATDPGALRFPVMWLHEDLGGNFERDQAIVKTWGARGRRTSIQQPAAYGAKSVQVGVNIKTDQRGGLYEHLDAVDDLVESGHVLCWAPERARERMFCVLDGKTPWHRKGHARSRQFSLIEVDWTEGVSE
jgi:hypothetical protein